MSVKSVLAAKALPVVPAPIQLSLIGFTQVDGSRVFTFEGLAGDRTRYSLTVRADLALARQYKIPLQDLPLLCRAMLESREPGEPAQAFTFSEIEMRRQADRASLLKPSRRRPPPRPSTQGAASAWPAREGA